MQAFLKLQEAGLLLIAGRDFLIVVASLVMEHRLPQLQHAGSVVGALRL